tara:strand:+ start:973 stop:2064 length:1092 start_codon:yes stop_codon:yes gene_type:complete
MVFGVIGLLRAVGAGAVSGPMAYGKEAGLSMASRVGATEGSGDERKLKEGIIKGPKGVLTRLNDGAKMASKVTGVTASISAMLKQSQIFTGVVGSIFQIIGAMIDILLIPIVPIFMPIVKGMAAVTELLLMTSKTGLAPGLLLIPVIGKFLFAAHTGFVAMNYIMDWFKTVDWGQVGTDIWNGIKSIVSSSMNWLFGTDNIFHKIQRSVETMILWTNTLFESVIKDTIAALLDIPLKLVTLVNDIIGVLNQSRWPGFMGGGKIFGDGIPTAGKFEKELEKIQKGYSEEARLARMKFSDRFELRGTGQVLTRETVTDPFGNERRVLDSKSLREGVDALYTNGEKARVYHVEREQEMLDMDFVYG